MESEADLQAMAENMDMRPVSFKTPAFMTMIGKMPSFNFVHPLPALVELRARTESGVIVRKDFDLDDDEYGNRPIDLKHVEKIASGLYERPDTPIQQIQLAVPDDIDGTPTYDWKRFNTVSPGVEFGMLTVYQGTPMHIENGQHTLEALAKVWDRVKGATYGEDLDKQKVLTATAAPIQVLVQSNRDEVTRMFVIAGMTKPISPALMTALDQSSYANKFGTQVGRRARLLVDEPDRLVYLRTAAREEALYSTAHMRGFTTATLIGFKDRTPDARESNVRKALEELAGPTGNLNDQLEKIIEEMVEVLDYAYDRIPGWKELRRSPDGSGMSPKQFRAGYLHGSPAGLYVIGGALGAARFTEISLHDVVDALAELPWGRSEGKIKKVDGRDQMQHPLFDGTLLRFEKVIAQNGDVTWTPTTAGGARTNYEAATEAVLRKLAKDSDFKALAYQTTLVHLGLRSSGRRGRPRKAATE
ncbi:DNA sulfur modification protein DndB [Streptomyces sp. S1D4-23]|uniref:DNA sulfur modification protein DndB n=1 Tax=Streptomyces sp. S1D4-23 TaxID=2594463 RepID=UPI0013DAF9B2|nr:DNA sulfur modification protein DndB [Streptomyces sp. S1D4-23]